MNGKSVGDDTANKRRILLSSILKKNPSAIIFCQEVPWKFKEEIAEGYEYVNTDNEAAIMWSPKKFKKGTEITNEDVTQLLEEAANEVKKNWEELLTRMTMTKLTSKQNTAMSTLAVSYHGRHLYSDEGKKHAFSILSLFLRKVIKKYGIDSCIIGGDFNFNTLEFGKLDDEVFGSYKLTRRSEDKRKIQYKDNFFSFPSEIIKVDEIKAVDLTGSEFKNLFKDSEPVELLDHDPIVGVLSFVTVRIREFG